MGISVQSSGIKVQEASTGEDGHLGTVQRNQGTGGRPWRGWASQYSPAELRYRRQALERMGISVQSSGIKVQEASTGEDGHLSTI
jgi:hypothetical protein